MIQIEQLDASRAEHAAALFVGEYARLREAFPMLSREIESVETVTEKIGGMGQRALAAVENGRLTGYLAWWEIGRFRGSAWRGAYVPEWGHGAIEGRRAEVYRALYRAAASRWTEGGCNVHAITLLGHDQEAREAWFWNNFGLVVVDAAREAQPLSGEQGTTLTIRRATAADASVLSELDAEHVLHYTRSPVYMRQPAVDSPESFHEFVDRPKNSVWLALDGDRPAGFMRFSGYDFDAVAVLQSDSAAFCNGAYIRPELRGRRAGVGLLDAALKHYSALGFQGVFVNFESFNPEAASFWPRYFRPVALSLNRVPEVLPDDDRA